MILPSWCINCPEEEGAAVLAAWAEDFRFRRRYRHRLHPVHWPWPYELLYNHHDFRWYGKGWDIRMSKAR